MTDPISHFGRIAQMDSSVRKVAAKGDQSADKAKAATGAGQSDELQLSEVARQATQEPQFDRAKVEAILESAADRVACMLLEHRAALIALADALCAEDELHGDRIAEIVTATLAA